ncbi:MAG: class I SAM-dependent methyltransferase [Desulfobacterales bacterium]|nr:class I SAM-dependent methyltransferase [Desulfobacterales bacterium]
MGSVILKSGREKSVISHHPWIFSGAIDDIRQIASNGEIVEVFSSDGKWLAYGSYSKHSQISVRLLSYDREDKISSDFFYNKLSCALKNRTIFNLDKQSNAYRLLNSESDGIPGLIIDKYNNFLVCQFLSAGSEYFRAEIINELKKLLPDCSIYERSDSSVRKKEGLNLIKGLIYGKEPDDLIEILENNLLFFVDIKDGHKTGFYLDQRDNRILLSQYAKDKEILNCFSYTGAFSAWALYGGASFVTNIEASSDAISISNINLKSNGLNLEKVENVCGDVFEVLRKYRDCGHKFDMIILDPPKFAESTSQVKKASRGYKDINMLAFKLLKQGGTLFTFSCSSLMKMDLFQKIVADACLDAKRDAQIIKRLTQGSDHPVSLNFPEGNYLKGLVLRVC